MNEDEVVKGCIPSTEVGFFGNSSEDPIPDAKYYLVRPDNSDIVFLMNRKPDYREEPFYNDYKESALNMEDYLIIHCSDSFNIENMTEARFCLCALGICPDENSVSYVFNDPTETKVDVFKTLNSVDSCSADTEVAKYYKTFDWHIGYLLSLEPFKAYIEKNYGSKMEKPKVTKESETLNKRLLI